MFTTKGLFAQVPCPNREKCLIPRCMFSHQDRGKQPLTDATAISKASRTIDADEGEQNGQRKRQKVGAPEESSLPKTGAPSASIQKPTTTQKPEVVKVPSASTAKRPSALQRDISPPPLRRKVQNGTSALAKPLSADNITSVKSAASPATPQARKPAPVKTPLKSEPLNPRARRTAPAVHNVRLRLLQALHDQYKRLNTELAKDANDAEEELVLSEQGLITRALNAEESACEQASIYSNVIKNKIMTYKRMTVSQWKEERAKEVAKEKAAEASVLSDTPTAKPAEPPKPIETGLSTEQEISILPRLYTPIDDLAKHGYVTTIPTPQEIEIAKNGIEASKGWEVCDRCKSRFQVFPGRREEDGALASGGQCTYHYGKPYWKDRSTLDPKAKREKKWRCCEQNLGDSPGCTTAEHHVFKVTEVKRLAAVLNFEKTPENNDARLDRPICIDGEMGYTVHGLELIRLTATTWPQGDELLDILIRPVGEILDLNSRYSGIWPKDITSATPHLSTSTVPPPAPPTSPQTPHIVPSPSHARALLFSLITPRTPIIGHGLENDLNATRFIHPTIIDTALLFPHKAGLPYRNGLKMLVYTHLGRHIQVVREGRVTGHDSREDANAAGWLVRWEVGRLWERLRREGWVVKGEKVVGPRGEEVWAGRGGGKEVVVVGSKRGREEMEEGS
ncbi:exonuclease protein [Rutstroemia sp. NJR-2017a BVV2]|nr:exonuclease protein [Rutstroemia sp. NJR-2017a BVV2]